MSRIIICIDDEKIVTNSIETLLRPYNKSFGMLESVHSAEEALEVIEDFIESGYEIPVVISDFIMPGMTGDELLIKIHKIIPKSKKIMLTGQSQIEGLKRVINEANLYRFLEKPWNNDDLLMTIRSALKEYDQEEEINKYIETLRNLNLELEQKVKERTIELEEKNQQLLYLSNTDMLTQLYNKFKLEEILSNEINRTKRYKHPLGIIIVDIDFFKNVNDTKGHLAGDSVLKSFANILKNNIRKTDFVGRWGGEEFLIICPETSLESTFKIAEKIRSITENTHFIEIENNITASFGVTEYSPNESGESVISRADDNLYKAKKNGRNSVISSQKSYV